MKQLSWRGHGFGHNTNYQQVPATTKFAERRRHCCCVLQKCVHTEHNQEGFTGRLRKKTSGPLPAAARQETHCHTVSLLAVWCSTWHVCGMRNKAPQWVAESGGNVHGQPIHACPMRHTDVNPVFCLAQGAAVLPFVCLGGCSSHCVDHLSICVYCVRAAQLP